MNISPIKSSLSHTNFRGQCRYCRNEDSLKYDKLWHKNSSVEGTIGAYHSNKTSKAYFADPMESISDRLKEGVDFIVYDNEPSYPEIDDVEKNYFGNKRKNYREDFEEIRQYYYRREMGGYADTADAKYQQWQAAECTKLYDKAGDLRYKKETAEDEIKKLQEEKSKIVAGINSTEAELKNQQEFKTSIDEHISTLKRAEKPYKVLSTIYTEKNTAKEQQMYGEALYRVNKSKKSDLEHSIFKELPSEYAVFADTPLTYKEVAAIKDGGFRLTENENTVAKEISKLEKTMKDFKAAQDGCEKVIEKMQAHIGKLQEKVSAIDKNISAKNSFIEGCKVKLKPIFTELKNFYVTQGIKVVKKG